jgi:hypothetical protein
MLGRREAKHSSRLRENAILSPTHAQWPSEMQSARSHPRLRALHFLVAGGRFDLGETLHADLLWAA